MYLQLWALQLEGGSHQAVLHRKLLLLQDDAADHFETLQQPEEAVYCDSNGNGAVLSVDATSPKIGPRQSPSMFAKRQTSPLRQQIIRSKTVHSLKFQDQNL